MNCAAEDITERYPCNPLVRAEVVRRRDELEQRNAAARREYMLRHRGLLLVQLLWCVPENDWRKVAL
jgi:hypothetical protein